LGWEVQVRIAARVFIALILLVSVDGYYEGWEHRRQWQGILEKQDGTYIVMFILGPLELKDAHVPTINQIINSLSPTR
jgi:hypothetical protein